VDPVTSPAASDAFPAGRQFAVTWGVSASHGGMTGALLRRSAAFATLADRPVDVLTFDVRDDYDEVSSALREDGRLSDGVRLRNLWDEMTGWSASPLRGAATKALTAFSPLAGEGRTLRRLGAAGELLQVDRLRADGTVAISDRRDVNSRGTVGGRSIVLTDAAGQPVVGFTRARAFYSAWLDLVVGDQDAFLLVDSKTAAPAIAGYVNDRVTKVHILHSAHLAGAGRPFGPVKASRRESLALASRFEAVVVLSERQRDDVDELLALGERLEVVPNAAALPAATPPLVRDPASVVAVAGLEKRKRLDHAVDAVALARSAGVALRLDVYGDGTERASLESHIERSGAADAIRLHGYDREAVSHFSEASAFTLTSTSEGFPLVLAEGMSRGCIPVSYDIPYGPADMITDGVDGLLVRAGDVGGLAAALERLATASPEELDGMRQAAIETAARFTDASVTAEWSRVLQRAAERRPAGREFVIHGGGAEQRQESEALVVTGRFRLTGVDTTPAEVAATVVLHGLGSDLELRRPATVRRTLRHGVWKATAEFGAASVAWVPAGGEVGAELELTIGSRTVRQPLAFGRANGFRLG
jgi:poly(glycerol-phosphate) alpha-glucosyltransferase